MKKTRILIASVFLFCCTEAGAQAQLKTSKWEMNIGTSGCIEQLIFKDRKTNDTIPFFQTEEKAGPVFYRKREGKTTTARWIPNGRFSYRSEIDGVQCDLIYLVHRGMPALKVTMTNHSPVAFQPEKAGLKLGIDTYMDKYPEWFGKYFPTLMRNEKTHFYGYLQTPNEHTLALVCEQPVASWSVDYNLGYQDPAPHWFMGHRIESLNLDLMNALPLPERHPQHLYELRQGESKIWILSLVNVGTLDQLEEKIVQVADIPMIDLQKTSFTSTEEAVFTVWGKQPQVTVSDDKGEKLSVAMKKLSAERTQVRVILKEVGLYTVQATANDKVAEAVLTVHQPWEWVMRKARENVLRYHQKPTSHAESWYGFYSAYLAARYFPDAETDRKIDENFELLFGKLHDVEKMEPLYHATRIQNTSTTIGMLIDKYQASGDLNDMERASRLGDWLMRTSQREDGAYCNHGTIYTSVIYIAKSMLELSQAEQELGKTDPVWKEAATRHYLSAKKAIDQLVASQGDFQTEGEMTFEDGMISCSALQIGMLATMQSNEADRKHYTDAMLSILNSHACLTQLRVPDGRRRQGTMRYWEAQYDVQMLPNMFNSPHGWSAWRAYATYYAYLLTGEEKWLEQTFNAMGAFAGLIDYKTGQLRWAFVVDPHLEVEQACSADTKLTFSDLSFGNPHPRLYETRRFVIGEQYVNMVSDWQTVNTQDNDVHEVFKCLGEAVLTHAFVIEQADGTFTGYNCRIKKTASGLKVIPNEKQITRLHINLKHPLRISFNGKEKQADGELLGWLF